MILPILNNDVCTDLNCAHRKKLLKRDTRRLSLLFVIRMLGIVCIALVLGGVGTTLLLQVGRAQPLYQATDAPLPAQATVQQFEIQTNQQGIRDLSRHVNEVTKDMTVRLDMLSKDVATMQGIGEGLGAILLILQVAQIFVGKDFRAKGGSSTGG